MILRHLSKKSFLLLIYLSFIKSQLLSHDRSERVNDDPLANTNDLEIINPISNDKGKSSSRTSINRHPQRKRKSRNFIRNLNHPISNICPSSTLNSISNNHCTCRVTNYVLIQCKNSKITSLKDQTISKFFNNQLYEGQEKLAVLILSSNNITHLMLDDFVQAGLYLDSASSNSRRKTVFSRDHFKKLRIIDLSHNQIQFIEDGVFKSLTGLRKIDLSHNKISTIPKTLFYNNRRLRSLDLSNNNLQLVASSAFKFHKRLQILDLSFNQLTCLHPDTFKRTISIEELYLNDNKITFLEASVLASRLTKMKMLAIYNNNWYCDCHLSWLSIFMDRHMKIIKENKQILIENGSRRRRNLIDTIQEKPPVCQNPPDLKGLIMFKLPPGDFICNEKFKNFRPVCSIAAGDDEQEVVKNPVSRSKIVANLMKCPKNCNCNFNSNEVVIDCAGKNLDDIPLNLPLNTTELRLGNNNLRTIPKRAFVAYKNLNRLDLSNNPLDKNGGVQENAFEGLTNLRKLAIYNTKIETLPKDIFIDLTNLEILLLHRNQLKCLHYSIFQKLTSVTTLSLFANKLETIPPNLFHPLRSLRQLHLAMNPLNCDCKMTNLIEFLKNNDVERSNAQCSQPLNLERVVLTEVQNYELNCYSGHAKRSLDKNLVIDENHFDFCNQADIRICPAFCECDSLGRWTCIDVELTNEKLEFINDFDEDIIGNLRELDLSNNQISRNLNLPGHKMISLSVLNLMRNQISSFGENSIKNQFINLPLALTEIHLGYNRLTILKSQDFGHLQNLRELHANDNQITCIEEDFFDNLSKNLKILNLENNQVKTLPITTFLTNLQRINVISNPIECKSRNAEMLKSFFVQKQNSNFNMVTDKNEVPFCRLQLDDGRETFKLLTQIDSKYFEKSPRKSCSKFSSICPKKCVCSNKTTRNGDSVLSINCNQQNLKISRNNKNEGQESEKWDQILAVLRQAVDFRAENNQIEYLEKFAQFQSLRLMNLAGNLVSQLESESFVDMPSLQTIILSKNRISCIFWDLVLVFSSNITS